MPRRVERVAPRARLRSLRRRHLYVLACGKPGQEARRLKDNRALCARFGDLFAVDNHAAVRRLLETGEDRQHRGFAAAGVAEDRDELASLDRGIHVFDSDERTGGRREDLGQAGEFEWDVHRISSALSERGESNGPAGLTSAAFAEATAPRDAADVVA